jgi:branched-chain amino acid aminotransferase
LHVLTWVNGSLIPPGEPCLAAGERGFLYGDGLFETILLYGGRPFAWERHAARLADGCRVLGIPYPEREIAAGLEAVLEALNGSRTPDAGGTGAGRASASETGSLRLAVTRGANPAGARAVLPQPGMQPTVVITARPGEPYPAGAYRSGQRAVTVSWPRNHLSPIVRLKTLNYLENILGRQEAAAAGADEGIFFNLKGELAEGTASNVFLVFEDGRIATPPAESGLLPGIARSMALALGGGLGLVVGEQAITRREFDRAREAFLTNSLLGIMPLVSCDGRPFGSGAPGEITLRLLEAYRRHLHSPGAAPGPPV